MKRLKSFWERTLNYLKPVFLSWRPLSEIQVKIDGITLLYIIMKNGQTYFRNLAVFTPQDFYSMFDRFSTLCIKGLKQINLLVFAWWEYWPYMGSLQNQIKYLWWRFLAKIGNDQNTVWKESKYGVISGPNTGKYGPEITPYLGNFHAGVSYSCKKASS